MPGHSKNKNKHKPSCKTGLKKNIISIEVFNREVTLCKNLFKENNGKCGWGRCRDCGVIPLLYKLRKGKLLDDSKEINKIKGKLFK